MLYFSGVFTAFLLTYFLARYTVEKITNKRKILIMFSKLFSPKETPLIALTGDVFHKATTNGTETEIDFTPDMDTCTGVKRLTDDEILGFFNNPDYGSAEHKVLNTALRESAKARKSGEERGTWNTLAR